METLKNKVAIVTGAGRGIGRAIANALASEGCHLMLCSNIQSEVDKVTKEVKRRGVKVFSLCLDLAQRENNVLLVGKTVELLGGIDFLINCAGVIFQRPFLEQSPEEWSVTMAVNLESYLMIENPEGGSIINFSSMAAIRPLTRVVGYSAAKAAVSNFTQWLAVYIAREYTPKVRVNALAPGFFVTKQNYYLLYNEDGSLTPRGQAILAHTPCGRFGEPRDLLSTVLWLLSPASSFITGVVVPVDGGFSSFSGV